MCINGMRNAWETVEYSFGRRIRKRPYTVLRKSLSWVCANGMNTSSPLWWVEEKSTMLLARKVEVRTELIALTLHVRRLGFSIGIFSGLSTLKTETSTQFLGSFEDVWRIENKILCQAIVFSGLTQDVCRRNTNGITKIPIFFSSFNGVFNPASISPAHILSETRNTMAWQSILFSIRHNYIFKRTQELSWSLCFENTQPRKNPDAGS